MLPQPKAVLFDWDNTLVDTWPTIHAALNRTYEAFGKETWSLNETKDRVRYSLRDSFPEYFGDRWKEASDHFYTQFEQLHLTELAPLEDAEALLSGLQSKGIYVGVVSNKTGRYLRKEVSHLGWDRFFGRLVGAGDATRDKPAPDPVHMVLEESGLPIDSSIWFVGDSNVDMEIAHATGCTAVLVNREEESHKDERLAEYPPHYHSPDCKGVLALIDELTA
ncbi:HAD family hydrolase [Aestuariispira ectoiniformans]|uniref:HAD family hydrolase n=1 Tax=Aestuariispira ectoiniformans TaxID=2775080 RepID=UPI00223B4844|nr:HAD family hydrolase [Aestuariispira ectoiniformans]